MRKQLATLATAAALAAALTLFGCKEEKAKTPEAAADTVPQAEETAEAETAEVSYSISTAGAGIFQYGKPIPFGNKAYTIKQDTIDIEGNEDYVISVYQDKERLMELRLDNENLIWRIEVFSSKFATAEGIHPGSTVEEFSRAYPNSSIYRTENTYEYIAANDTVSAIFDIAGGVSVLPEKDNLKLADYLSKFKGWKIFSIIPTEKPKAEENATNAEETPVAETGEGVYAGQAIKEFVAAFEKQYTVKKEFVEDAHDGNYDAYFVYENSELLFEARFDNSNIGIINIHSPKIKTDRGIGVGSSSKELLAKYDFSGNPNGDNGDGIAYAKDFDGTFWLREEETGKPKFVMMIDLGSSLMITTDLRIIKKPEASK